MCGGAASGEESAIQPRSLQICWEVRFYLEVFCLCVLPCIERWGRTKQKKTQGTVYQSSATKTRRFECQSERWWAEITEVYLREKGIEKKTESKRAWLGWFVFANLQFCAQSLPHILKMIIHRCLSFNSLCTINYETAQCCWQRSVTGYRFLADMRTNWQEEQKGDLYNRYIHVIMHCKMSVHIMAQY